ncbi:MAG: hypothetical protein IJM30_06290 [Thermoguttaceae bacterium]|nr:hypothetical protein [Thermoguttaceae bacterium]
MSKSFGLCFVFGLAALVSTLGCCRSEGGAPSSDGTSVNSSENGAPSDAPDTGAKPEVDETPLDVDNPETPEGVVNAFFKTFFSGDDDGAFALLTRRAQEARRDSFAAQESATARWRITKKMKPIQGRVLVAVDVEDYTDSGAIQVDELTFVLTNVDYGWRIAGFSVGDLAINFEDASGEEMLASDEAENAPPKTARASEPVEESNGTIVR